MTPMQVQLVRASFQLVEPIADQGRSDLFYARLFSAQPQLRSMFRGDMHAQGAALMRMIAAAVRQLDRPDVLMPLLRYARRAPCGLRCPRRALRHGRARHCWPPCAKACRRGVHTLTSPKPHGRRCTRWSVTPCRRQPSLRAAA